MTGYPVEGFDVPRGYYAPDEPTAYENSLTAQAEELAQRERFCDCCEKPFPRDQVSRVWVTGIETFACDKCRGVDNE